MVAECKVCELDLENCKNFGNKDFKRVGFNRNCGNKECGLVYLTGKCES